MMKDFDVVICEQEVKRNEKGEGDFEDLSNDEEDLSDGEGVFNGWFDVFDDEVD